MNLGVAWPPPIHFRGGRTTLGSSVSGGPLITIKPFFFLLNLSFRKNKK
jgi:hypothetical protein